MALLTVEDVLEIALVVFETLILNEEIGELTDSNKREVLFGILNEIFKLLMTPISGIFVDPIDWDKVVGT